MTYADGQLIMKFHSCTPVYVIRHSITERKNFTKNGLALQNFEN